MSDMTTQFSAEAPRARANPKAEFYAYFALIFAATLPLAILTWALTAARQMTLPEKGPIKRAWSQARIITPMIFSA
ncbi:protein pufQ [Maribius pontilimi]|uniref:Protein pufQ n=1 Tax=Palleronia pontilimi TaxID=1964209 RepID=A0A934M8I7_9RHOB|nr:cytochrome PufQ [Palleronia pontilimi]MBJ3761447.1 protein pufQ [Palleronia pontilimi]